MQEHNDYSQHTQWVLLEKWFLEQNERKEFTLFLTIHNYPNNINDVNALYYLQICKKLWYANKVESNQLDWVRQKMKENKHYLESDAEMHEFEHEGYLKQENRELKKTFEYNTITLDSYRRLLFLLCILLYISSIGSVYIIHQTMKTQPWWLI